jgi:hypothetical protein
VGIDQADGDRIGLGRDRGVERVDHLRDVGGLRPGPLVIDPQERTGVLDAVLGRHEERVVGDVVDEHETPFRMIGKRPRIGCPRPLGRAGEKRRRAADRHAAHQRPPRQTLRHFLLDLPLTALHVVLPDASCSPAQ